MSDETLLEFPCDFPIKIMGRSSDDFVARVLALVESHAGPVAEGRFSQRPSRDGNFLALTVVIEAQSKAQLDALYAELSAHELVLMVL
jgi:putative lipoic acid-binding regulatory protein